MLESHSELCWPFHLWGQVDFGSYLGSGCFWVVGGAFVFLSVVGDLELFKSGTEKKLSQLLKFMILSVNLSTRRILNDSFIPSFPNYFGCPPLDLSLNARLVVVVATVVVRRVVGFGVVLGVDGARLPGRQTWDSAPHRGRVEENPLTCFWGHHRWHISWGPDAATLPLFPLPGWFHSWRRPAAFASRRWDSGTFGTDRHSLGIN